MKAPSIARTFAFIGVVVGCAAAGYAMAAVAQDVHSGKVIRITAQRFVFVPNEITLTKGRKVTLEFRTRDVLMGFNAPDLAQRADILPGQVTRVTLVPQKAGTYSFLCDVFCGSGHENMNGVIHVVD